MSKVILSTLEPYHMVTARIWRNNPAIYNWCRQNTLISIQDQDRWYNSLANRQDVKMYSVLNLEKDFVGVCGFTSIDLLNSRAEFSLYIGPEYQKRGYARDALKALFSHGFDCFGFNSIWGETFEGNPAYNLFLSLGMKHEGTRRKHYFKNGKFIDAHLVSVLRSEWQV